MAKYYHLVNKSYYSSLVRTQWYHLVYLKSPRQAYLLGSKENWCFWSVEGLPGCRLHLRFRLHLCWWWKITGKHRFIKICQIHLKCWVSWHMDNISESNITIRLAETPAAVYLTTPHVVFFFFSLKAFINLIKLCEQNPIKKNQPFFLV